MKRLIIDSNKLQTLATGVTEDSRSDSESADDEYEEEESDKKSKWARNNIVTEPRKVRLAVFMF